MSAATKLMDKGASAVVPCFKEQVGRHTLCSTRSTTTTTTTCTAINTTTATTGTTTCRYTCLVPYPTCTLTGCLGLHLACRALTMP